MFQNFLIFGFKSTLFGVILAVGSFVVVGCGKSEPPPAPKQPVIPAAPPPAPEEEVDEEIPVYIYKGDRFRDPFMPVGQVSSYQPDAVFDPQRAAVTAIIFGRVNRTAVLRVGGAGSYFVKAGRIFDIMGKTQDGFRAKVLVDRVIISGEAEEVYELKIRDTEEDES